LPKQHLPNAASGQVTLEYPPHGGHVGFASGAIPGHLNWLPKRIVDFLSADRP
jgi:predicted alpha/beta-fold hydrolase